MACVLLRLRALLTLFSSLSPVSFPAFTVAALPPLPARQCLLLAPRLLRRILPFLLTVFCFCCLPFFPLPLLPPSLPPLQHPACSDASCRKIDLLADSLLLKRTIAGSALSETADHDDDHDVPALDQAVAGLLVRPVEGQPLKSLHY